jgi:hypothetical protein
MLRETTVVDEWKYSGNRRRIEIYANRATDSRTQ